MSVPFHIQPFFRNITNNTLWEVTREAALQNIIWHNDDPALRYLQMFNAASGDVTLGTTTPDFVLQLNPNSTNTFDFGGMKFDTAITLAVTTTATGNTAGTSSWLAVGIY